MGLIPAAMLGGVPAEAISVLNSGAFASEESDYLSRTLTSSATWTFSVWIKRASISAALGILEGGLHINVGDTITAVGLTTTELFRDVSEWYHICVSNNGLEINGVNLGSVTTSALTNPDIGRNGTSYFNGYLSEVYFIDGQSLNASNFAEEDSVTGQWNPIEYAGTYGTNGFYLDFEDGTDLGKDVSGNTNDFTNTGVTQSTDTPTDNHCILNSIGNIIGSTSNAGLNTNGSSAAAPGTIALSTGKWYWEYLQNTTGSQARVYGVKEVEGNNNIGSTGGYGYDSQLGRKWIDTVLTTGIATSPDGTVIGLAFDIDAGTLEIFKNNVTLFTITGIPAAMFKTLTNGGGTPGADDIDVRYTEDSWTYAAPSGFLAISSKNLPTPDIVLPPKYFKPIIYDDGAGAKTVGFQPDLVWFKARSAATNHRVVDSVRGATLSLAPATDVSEITESTGLTSFDTNGFTVGADTDYSDTTGVGMVAWSWLEGITQGLDIVGYIGDGVAGNNISHNLGATPHMMIVKARNPTSNQQWRVYHHGMSTSDVPENINMSLDVPSAIQSLTTIWNDTQPTSSVFTVGSSSAVNQNTKDYIAYIFTSIVGFSRLGHYEGVANVNGAYVYTGFKPAFIMIKGTGATGWLMFDTSRYLNNVITTALLAQSTAAEGANSDIDILSNGFKLRENSSNTSSSGVRYIYMAFAESPFQYSRAR